MDWIIDHACKRILMETTYRHTWATFFFLIFLTTTCHLTCTSKITDMDEKVETMLKIIENEGESFAQRVEMYYRKRPELINHVEDSYRAYRALAERYDHLSKDLQSANRTIATVFPEQVQFDMDDDDDYYEENSPTTSTSRDDPIKEYNESKANIPKVPSVPKKEFRSQSMLLSRKVQPNSASSAKAIMPPSSGLSQEEALEEIDKLQKEILALQTEKEFSQSVYERCHAKCCGIENQIIGMQAKISSLQDEFGISKVIDDNEARTLMAATALKSCHETLVRLQEKQEQSAEEAKIEHQRIKEVHQKLKTLKGEFLSEQTDLQEPTDEHEFESENIDQQDMEPLRETIKSQLDAESKASFTVTQLAERIDELVDKVVNLETAVSSQDALVNRIRSDTDELHVHVKNLEDDKETLKENSENMSNKLKELEEELHRLKILNQSIIDQNNSLLTHFTEASCNIDHLSANLQTVKPDEEVENAGLIEEIGAALDAKADGEADEHEEKLAPSNNALISKAIEMEKEEKRDQVPAPGNFVKAEESNPTQKLHVLPEHLPPTQDKEDLNDELEELGTDVEDQPNWRQFFVGGLEDREKLMLEEYTSVLQNYREVRKKLSDVEKKNRDGFFELALQIRELKNALVLRDEEIQSLRKTSSLQQNQVENHDSNLTKYKYSHRERSPESMTQEASCLDSNLSSLGSPQQPVFDSPSEHHIESRGRTRELAAFGGTKRYPSKEVRNEIKMKPFDSHQAASAIEEKFRSDIDELLEENLEFWLRFSTSFHQIQKFQTSLHDLKVELSKLKDKSKQDGSDRSQSFTSEARPIYTHMREIQTELALWLENNAVLKDEMQGRNASLCNIQDELSSCRAAEAELSEYQVAKFQGEVLNMKQESNKIADQLQAGLDRVGGLKVEVEDTLAKLDEELGLSVSKHRSSSNRAKIPLRSFLFGIKLKKHKAQKSSIFSCGNPALQKQYSNIVVAGKLSQ